MSKATHWTRRMDPFVATLFGVVLLATLLPCQGQIASFFDYLTDAAIVLLFFLHGAKLSREAILSGMLNWRLHLATLLATFALFPLLGLGLIRLPGLDPALSAGLLYLTLLPSTVQSSIAFTAIAKGNVSAAVCAATLSNVLGMFLTPMLVATLMQVDGGNARVSMDAVWKISLQLLLPFLVGHLARPWIAAWVSHHKLLVGRVDRSSILLVVYTAFSAAVINGLWSKCSAMSLLGMGLISSFLLTVVLVLCWWMGKRIGLSREDSIVLLFCGSKKSLASGVPMAGVLFSEAEMGLILLPVMIFHQIQLIVCAIIAGKMAKASNAAAPESSA
jgi:sodium/bile acid cotransporter 7